MANPLPRAALPALLATTVLLILVVAPSIRSASPSSGFVSETQTSTAWTGQSYVAAAVALPDFCPPETDPDNTICDHFWLDVSLPGDFWANNTGALTVSIQWDNPDNDFDLFVYGPDGELLGESFANNPEVVTVGNPVPGRYEVRVMPFLVADSAYAGAATLAYTESDGPVSNPVHPDGGLSFAPAVIIDPQRMAGEPLIQVAPDGLIWNSAASYTQSQGILSRSIDDGDTYKDVSPARLGPDPTCPVGGADADLAVDDQGRLYWADLHTASFTNFQVAISTDQGSNWTCSEFSHAGTYEDRQWLAIDNGTNTEPGPDGAADNTIFLTYRDSADLAVGTQATSMYVLSSDNGLVYQPASTSPRGEVRTMAFCGDTQFDPVLRNLYLLCRSRDFTRLELTRGHVLPGQRTGIPFETVPLPESPGGRVSGAFPSLATDDAGGLYAVWADGEDYNVYISTSNDAGDSWSTPVQVNGAPADMNVFPWVKAGAPGQAAVVWYGTDVSPAAQAFIPWEDSRVEATRVKWYPYLAVVRGLSAENLAIFQTRVLGHPIHYGPICTEGLSCSAANDRIMLDYLSLSLDKNGAARVAFNDTTNQHHGAAMFEARQLTGPTVLGTALLGHEPATRLENPVADPAGDALSPRIGALAQNRAAMDLRSLRVSQPTPGELEIRLNVADLASLQPPPGSSGIVWLARFQVRASGDEGEESYRVFYLGAQSNAGDPPSYFSGSGTSADDGVPGTGCVATAGLQDFRCRIMLYPEERAATGSFDAENGTITVRAPLGELGAPQVGDVLYSVTAYSFGVNAPPPDSPPGFGGVTDPMADDVDATRAIDYVIRGADDICPPNCGPDGGAKVTGGGAIAGALDGTQARFSFNARESTEGKLRYQDGELNFRSTRLTRVTIDGGRATISGEGVVDGQATDFTVQAVDNGEPGTSDRFAIELETGYSNNGQLTNGNIQVH